MINVCLNSYIRYLRQQFNHCFQKQYKADLTALIHNLWICIKCKSLINFIIVYLLFWFNRGFHLRMCCFSFLFSECSVCFMIEWKYLKIYFGLAEVSKMFWVYLERVAMQIFHIWFMFCNSLLKIVSLTQIKIVASFAS